MIASPEKYKNIAAAFGENVTGLSLTDAARLAIKAVKDLAQDLDIPDSLANLCLPEEKIDLLSHNAVQDACMITNPRDMSPEDVKLLFRKVLKGVSECETNRN